MMILQRSGLFCLLLASAVLSGCAVNPASGNPELVFMSEDKEIQIGRELHRQIIDQIPLYEDEQLQAYVRRVGEKVAAHSHRSNLYYRFFVLDRPEINAFALPGGYIYIFRGLLAYFNSEAELAAVLGHEIAHVTARHAVRQHRNQMLAQILATAVAIEAGGQAADLSSLLGNVLLRGYGRELELEADRLGAEYMARADYDPQQMLQVIAILKHQEEYEKKKAALEDREPNIYHGVFASHPENDDRLKTVVRAADQFKTSSQGYIGREPWLAVLDGMVFGPGKKDGVRRGMHFYHPEFGFAFTLPQGWRLHNEPTRLLLYGPEGKATAQLTAHDLNRRIDGAEFARERLNIRNLKDQRNLVLDDMPVFLARFPESTLFANRHIHIAIVYVDDQALVFQAVNKKKDEDFALAAPFDELVQSFHRLTDTEREHARPLRLRMRAVEPGLSYASLARESPLEQDADILLRLLNQHYPSGEPRPGDSIKTIR